MEKDCIIHVKTCEKHKNHTNLILDPSSEMAIMVSPWAFSIRALDLVGVINPKSSEGNKYISGATEYFTKWEKEIPLRSYKGPQNMKFFTDNIITIFGVPSHIIMDNGNNFRRKHVREFCKAFKIK